jgi:UDP-2,4-diacetamido-2,4,6-trideoxy-beta-L-altropyranose hydrolase
MRVVVRADASPAIGSGHVMRCLTLAERLGAGGASVRFISRACPGELAERIHAQGHELDLLPSAPDAVATFDVDWQQDAQAVEHLLRHTPPDWLIVDHYGLDRHWEEMLRPHVGRIMAIDDLANRPHRCDLLLDQNYYPALEQRYRNLVPVTCHQLLGPCYALLRQEFVQARKILAPRDGQVRRILVFFGGGDPANESLKAVEACLLLDDSALEIDVVLSPVHVGVTELAARCGQLPQVRIHRSTSEMAALMLNADLAIGSGGTVTWERCALGLPALVFPVAANQEAVTAAVAAAGAQLDLGDPQQWSAAALAAELARLRASPELLRVMSARALALVGDASGADLVAEALWSDRC